MTPLHLSWMLLFDDLHSIWSFRVLHLFLKQAVILKKARGQLNKNVITEMDRNCEIWQFLSYFLPTLFFPTFQVVQQPITGN